MVDECAEHGRGVPALRVEQVVARERLAELLEYRHQIAAGYREVASITIIAITLLTLGIAIVARSFGLKVGIRAE